MTDFWHEAFEASGLGARIWSLVECPELPGLTKLAGSQGFQNRKWQRALTQLFHPIPSTVLLRLWTCSISRVLCVVPSWVGFQHDPFQKPSCLNRGRPPPRLLWFIVAGKISIIIHPHCRLWLFLLSSFSVASSFAVTISSAMTVSAASLIAADTAAPN